MSQKKLSIVLAAACLTIAHSASASQDLTTTSEYRTSSEYKPVSFASSNSDPKTHFEFSFTPIALKAGASNLNYVIYNKALPIQSPSWTEQELRPSYAFAFELEGRYHINSSADVGLNWTHMYSNVSSNVAAPSSLYFLGPDYDIGPDASVIRNATGRAKFRYDVINLDAGQSVNLGRYAKLRIFGGLSNGLLREEVISTYSGTNGAGANAGPFSLQQDVRANFTGLGPRAGVDAIFDTSWGVSFYGEAAGSALIGSSYAKTAYTGRSTIMTAIGTSINSQFVGDQNVTQVLPGFDTKVGVDYTRTVYHGVAMSIGAGYQAAVYINAINQYLPESLVTSGIFGTSVSTGGIFVATMNHTQSNYSVQGPFIKLSVKF